MSSVGPYSYSFPWDGIFLIDTFRDPLRLTDHIGGFDQDMKCKVLEHINAHCYDGLQVVTDYRFSQGKLDRYPNLRFSWYPTWVNDCFKKYHVHPDLRYENFLCSFNGSPHVSRKLLVAVLKRFNWFDPIYSSKNFIFTEDKLDGHLKDWLDNDQHRLYRKFFIGEDSEDFFSKRTGFGHVQFDHAKNIYNLEQKITNSFVNLVSESMATSSYPFVTEKFCYSVITRGLFLAFAQPGWHQHLETFYGFRKYDKIFDYRFDLIQNPIYRLLELMGMLSRFSNLSRADWHDLHSIEQETIEHNYDHYFSGAYHDYHIVNAV
jgi:hypothetical protein